MPKQLRLDARHRSVEEIGPGDFVKVYGTWKEVTSNTAQGLGNNLPRTWSVRTVDGTVYSMYDILLYAKAEDFS